MRASEERLNLVMGVEVVDGLKTITYGQHSYEPAVYSLECQYDGARDIKEWLEEDFNKVAMTDVLPPMFSEVDWGETDQDHIQLWEVYQHVRDRCCGGKQDCYYQTC